MQCHACGHGGLVDSWERDLDWRLEVKVPADFGCARCFGDDAAAAWEAMHSRRAEVLLQESHFSVRVTECTCGQAFVVVFTERIDFVNGEDPQDWLTVPLTRDERSKLTAASEAELTRLITELSRERRFLARSYPPGAALRAWWRTGGLVIGPHD